MWMSRIKTTSVNGKRYFVTVVYEYSRCFSAMSIHDKSEVSDKDLDFLKVLRDKADSWSFSFFEVDKKSDEVVNLIEGFRS